MITSVENMKNTMLEVRFLFCKFNNQYFKMLEKKSELNFNCINFPTPVNQIKIFERVNNVSVNVFS